MLSARAAYRISLVGAAVVMSLVGLAQLMPDPAPTCGGLDEGYETIAAFELVRSVADLQAIFGVADDDCRKAIVKSLHATNVIDAAIYIPTYTLFLVFVLLGLRAGSVAGTSARTIAGAGAVIAFASALADYVENTALFQLEAAIDVPSVWIPVLIGATSFKWIGLGLASSLGGVVLWQRGGLARLAILPCAVALVMGIVALFSPATGGPWLLRAMTVAWLPLLAVALAGAFGRRAASEE